MRPFVGRSWSGVLARQRGGHPDPALTFRVEMQISPVKV